MATSKRVFAVALIQFILATIVNTDEIVVAGQDVVGNLTLYDGTADSSLNGSTNQNLLLQLLRKMETQEEIMQSLQQGLDEVKLKMSGETGFETQKQEDRDVIPQRPRDCYDLLRLGTNESGVYTIYPDCGRYLGKGVRVRCDMEVGGGGWTVILLRRPLEEGQVDFNQPWRPYRLGFGDPDREYWIGNDIILQLTSKKVQHLRVDMSDWDGVEKYAEYARFHVTGRDDEYRLFLEGYSGTAGDSLWKHNGMRFSTYDRDNDGDKNTHCADSYDGGFWFNSCHDASPTGEFRERQETYHGINWYTFNNDRTSMKTMTWKLRPADCYL